MNSRRFFAAGAALLLCACSGSSSTAPSTTSTASAGPPPQVKTVNVAATGNGQLPAAGGGIMQLSASAIFSDGSSLNVTSTATWTSTDNAIATVNSTGLVTGVSGGPVIIRAAYGGIVGAYAFSVFVPATRTLTGTVNESGTSRPIASATVSVTPYGFPPRTTTTDASGRFSFANVAENSATITVSASGYLGVTRLVNVNATLGTQAFYLATPTPCPALGFDDLTAVQYATVTTSSMCGLTLRPTLAEWFVSIEDGHPPPAIYMAFGTAMGEVRVTAGGQPFKFVSVDLYSSVTNIPYVLTGTLGSTTVFTVTNTQPGTFGNFATVTNPQSSAPIDALTIRLTNPGSGSQNPIGLDNIKVSF